MLYTFIIFKYNYNNFIKSLQTRIPFSFPSTIHSQNPAAPLTATERHRRLFTPASLFFPQVHTSPRRQEPSGCGAPQDLRFAVLPSPRLRNPPLQGLRAHPPSRPSPLRRRRHVHLSQGRWPHFSDLRHSPEHRQSPCCLQPEVRGRAEQEGDRGYFGQVIEVFTFLLVKLFTSCVTNRKHKSNKKYSCTEAMPPPKAYRGFSFFGSGESNKVDDIKNELVPSLKLHTDKDVYRPGDSVDVTIEISNLGVTDGLSESQNAANKVCSLLVERLTFEMKGIEKLDTQWFATQKPLPGSKQRRGEHVFMDCSTPAIVSNQIVSSGAIKTYVVRTSLPSIIPPSYRGATIRYLYYVRSTLSGRWLILENGHSHRETVKDFTELEARIPLQIWVTQKASGLQIEEGRSDGIVPATTIQMDIYWREVDGDSDWARANEIYDGVDEGYESSRDEISSVSSYNPMKENLHKTFGSSLSLQSARSSNKDSPYLEGGRPSLSSYVALPRLSVAEVLYDSSADILSSQKSSAVVSPSQQQKHVKPFSTDDDVGVSSVLGSVEPVASEGFIRGRSYNIRLDDQVLLRFSPKNSDSTYYFSDMIGGTLTFFHEGGARRCLEVSITLETSETISRRFVHPSRRNSSTITKVQSDYHEVVADLVQTSFLFSIPMDGPMSFSTPHVSVQWSLRFEFFTTPKNLDWTRYEHPLLIEGRDKSDWVLPITVHAPPSGTPASHPRNEKPISLEPLWVHN